ncbi:hypothetical protein ACN47E_001787 [Coniothyrium glycines]
MDSPIECLPVEVFDIIATSLDLPEYQALRLSSAKLRLLTFSTFAKRFFSILTTTLGPGSLQRLQHVAIHPHLFQYPSVLDIRLLTHRDYKLLKNISRVGKFPPPKRFPKVSGVKPEHVTEEAAFYDDVSKNDDLKAIVEPLTLALRGFEKLRVLRFRTRHTEPRGWQNIAIPLGDQTFRAKCCQAVLDAIVKSEVQLHEFSLAKSKRSSSLSKCANLGYPFLQFPLHFFRPLQYCFSNLEILHLSIVSDDIGAIRTPGWENGVSNFVAAAPCVKQLALSLDRSNRVSNYSAAVLHSLALTCRLPELNSLHLVNCAAHEKDVVQLICAHSGSLQHVTFSELRLLSGIWSSIWLALKTVINLRNVRLSSLAGPKSPVLFRRRDQERLNVTLDTSKAQQTMSDLLDSLLTACEIGIEHHLAEVATA